MALHLQGQGPKKKAATVSHHMQGVFRGGGGGGRGGSKGGREGGCAGAGGGGGVGGEGALNLHAQSGGPTAWVWAGPISPLALAPGTSSSLCQREAPKGCVEQPALRTGPPSDPHSVPTDPPNTLLGNLNLKTVRRPTKYAPWL